MTLAQKLKRSARAQRYYQRHRARILEQKRGYMAETRHRAALEKSIAAARLELARAA